VWQKPVRSKGSASRTRHELIALSEVAAEYDGMYISHMRDEGANMLAAVDELLTIARDAAIRAEIYHFKSSGQANWPLFMWAMSGSVGGSIQIRS
jgi:N-acyl-D-aspartate/D-glutamate deacylase